MKKREKRVRESKKNFSFFVLAKMEEVQYNRKQKKEWKV